MKAILLSLALLFIPAAYAEAPEIKVAERSEPVAVALEESLNKKRAEITAADLETVKELELPHIHIKSFKENDFAGLTKLKKLYFYSLLHNRGRTTDPIAIGDKVFAKLASLETLKIQEQLGQLPDDVFAGLTSLKVLDLTNSTLTRLPTSLMALPKIETVYYDGRGLSKEDYATLQKKLGDKLKIKIEEEE